MQSDYYISDCYGDTLLGYEAISGPKVCDLNKKQIQIH